MVTHWMQIAVRLRNGLRENSIKIMVSFRVIEPKSIRLGDMFVDFPAMSSHISLCISPSFRLSSPFPIVQYNQLAEHFITRLVISRKLAELMKSGRFIVKCPPFISWEVYVSLRIFACLAFVNQTIQP